MRDGGLKTTDLVQIFSALAIVVGLILVLVELRQSRSVAEAQLLSDQASIDTSILIGVMGENTAKVLAVACDEPQELSREQGEVLQAYLRSRLMQLTRLRSIQKATGLLESRNFEQETKTLSGGFLGTPYGRYIWERDRAYWVANVYPEISRIFDETLSEVQASPRECTWRDFKHIEYLERLEQ